MTRSGRNVTVRSARMTDSDLLLAWQQDPATRRYFRNPEIPTESEHATWMQGRIADTIGLFGIIVSDNEPAGMIRFDLLEEANANTFDVSILVAPAKRGQGIAAAALEAVKDRIPSATLYAEVHPDNAASQKLFSGAGFVDRGKIFVYNAKQKQPETKAAVGRSTVSERAVDTNCLGDRSSSNKRLGTADFDAWVDGLLAELSFSSVLDICCGTGNQLVLYAGRPGINRIVGVDASSSSLETARRRLGDAGGHCDLHCLDMDQVFDSRKLDTARFDLISCVYGLYYSSDVRALLSGMIDHLAPSGQLLVIGPYGKNNQSLVDILERHFTLPAEVVRSTTSFMEEEVITAVSGLPVRTETFVNKIVYPTTDDLMAYWRATTFFAAEFEAAVRNDVDRHIFRHESFTIEKHVMAVIAGGESP